MSASKKALNQQEEFAALLLRQRARGFDNTALLAALEVTPRRQFINAQWADYFYEKGVIPIICGEYIERLDEQLDILHALDLQEKHRVLEIGTGSGFSAALMAMLVHRVVSVERYKTLCDLARQHFQALKRDNIILRHSDGRNGQPGAGPYDRIVIWPAMAQNPDRLLESLALNGVLIAPIGPEDGPQIVTKFTKVGSRFEKQALFEVYYQPFIDGIAQKL